MAEKLIGARPRAVAAIVAALGLLLVILTPAGMATAAPPYTTTGHIDSIAFTSDTVANGHGAKLSAAWSIADDATSPAGFTIPLPADLQGRTDTFPLLADGGDSVMGTCHVRATELYCDLDETYLAENPREVHGTVEFWVTVRTEVSQNTETTYDFGDVSTTVTVTPNPNTCPDCVFEGRDNQKYGDYFLDDEGNHYINWAIRVKAPATGMVGGETVTVTDPIGANLEVQSVYVRETTTVGADGVGNQNPIDWQNKPQGEYTVQNNDGTVTVSFESEAGHFYDVRIVTRVLDGGASTYRNTATVEIEGQQTVEVTASRTYSGGSGTGIGTDFGRFAITKDVIGTGANAAQGVSFTGTYVVTPRAGDPINGTFEVTDGGTWTSIDYPRDSTVTITEVAPTTPENVTWADPVYSEQTFTLPSGGQVAVTLTNEATLRVGSFSVAKALTGTGAHLVPADATFDVEYAYPAGAGYPAGSGTLVVGADGVAVTSPEVPAGAVVTLTEVTPGAISGATWGTPTFAPTTVTIGADETVAVTLTNEITATPPTSTTPPTPTTPPATPELPNTGGGDLTGAFLVGALLLLAGLGVRLVARRS